MSKRAQAKVQKSRAQLARVAASSLLPMASKKQVRQLARQEAAVLLNPRGVRPRRQRMAQRVRADYMATDGLTRSRVHTNTSVIEDRFELRREKIADIAGATAAFTAQQSLYVNPGNSVLFPIFSQIAATYEEYRVNTLRFVFETEAYTASGTTQSAGIVCLATNFDPDDNAFSNLTQMENYCGSVKGPPYAPIIQHDVIKAHRIRRARRAGMADLSLNNYFVYSSANQAAPSTSTAKFYDIGLFQLAVANMVGTGTIGELYVEYSFTMIRPKQQTPLGQNLLSTHYSSTSASMTNAAPYTGMAITAGSNITLTLSTTNMTIPTAGRYTISYFWTGSTASVRSAFGAGTGATLVSTYAGGNSNPGCLQSNAAFWSGNVFDIASGGGTITLTGGTFSSSSGADLFVSQVSSGLALQSKFSPSRDTSVENTLIQSLLYRLAALERGLEEKDADYSDEDSLHVEPEFVGTGQQPSGLRRSPNIDLVVRSNGTLEHVHGGPTPPNPRVALSKSVLGSLIGLP
jgi:hypothetical protein